MMDTWVLHNDDSRVSLASLPRCCVPGPAILATHGVSPPWPMYSVLVTSPGLCPRPAPSYITRGPHNTRTAATLLLWPCAVTLETWLLTPSCDTQWGQIINGPNEDILVSTDNGTVMRKSCRNELADLSWFSHHFSPGLCELESAVISRHFVADSFLQAIFANIYFSKVQKCLHPILQVSWLIFVNIYKNMLPNSFFGYLLKIRIGWKLN